MSNPPATLPPSKSVSASSTQSAPPSQPQHSLSPGPEGGYPQRRGGGSGSYGAGSAARSANASGVRSAQAARKQHRNLRRPRLESEEFFESAAMKSTTTRKGQTSITHLMNFSLPPRPQPGQLNFGNRHGGRRHPPWGMGSGYHAVDKARYVHANYRFIVNASGNYHDQAVDADVHLEWSSVLQILASAQSQGSSCPICLSNPVAPRMAKCGHIFCLPCLIRYMHSTDDANPVPEKKARWKKCPICWDSIYQNETRPVRWFTGQEANPPREGGDVVLRLIRREPGSTLALPRDGADALPKTDEIPWYFAAEVMDYARVMKGSEDYMTEQYNLEIEELRVQEQEDELMFGEDTEWTRRAMNAIQDAREHLKGIGNPPAMPQHPVERKPRKSPIPLNDDEDEVPEMYFIQHALKSGQSSSRALIPRMSDNLPSEQPNNLSHIFPSLQLSPNTDSSEQLKYTALSERQPKPAQTATVSSSRPHTQHPHNAPHHPESPYFFYQALLHYYLSPLDIRILKAAFGPFSSFPSTLLPRVTHVSPPSIIDADLRKRAKYLAHLPHGCEVSFLECDWTDIVPADVLAQFKPELDRRMKRNRDKEVREEKERVRAEREDDEKRWAAARRKRPEPTRDTLADADFQPLAVAATAAANDAHAAAEASPPWRTGNRQGFAPLASPGTSPSQPRTVWGTAAVAAPSTPEQAPLAELDMSGDDGWLQGWEKDLLLDDAEVLSMRKAHLAAAAQTTTSTAMVAPAGQRSAGQVGKRGKKKKITLMSTNARRGA